MPSFFFKATSTTEIYTLYLHDALPISSRPWTGTAMSLMAWTTACCAFWRPRLMIMGLAPAARFLRPSLTMDWASTVAVVVPSPAMSLVLVAASLRSWAPMFSNGSGSSISLATVTPSWLTVGAPYFLSSATLRPLGPNVVLTASARVSTPILSRRRASMLKAICLGTACLLVGWFLRRMPAGYACSGWAPTARGGPRYPRGLDLHIGSLAVSRRVAA